jgi:hypothetical protein
MTGHAMTAICEVLGLARRTAYYVAQGRPDGRQHRAADGTVLQQIRAVRTVGRPMAIVASGRWSTGHSGQATTANASGG